MKFYPKSVISEVYRVNPDLSRPPKRQGRSGRTNSAPTDPQRTQTEIVSLKLILYVLIGTCELSSIEQTAPAVLNCQHKPNVVFESPLESVSRQQPRIYLDSDRRSAQGGTLETILRNLS